MKAQLGDEIVVPGRHVGNPDRHGRIMEVRGEDGAPPYVVDWDDGHHAVVYPGAECRVVHRVS
ncbi:MAG: hypothetical protein JWN08_3539 [Frankiales bacterium]|nr:hypothetical protein [Frankiales bacterium]